ncbi:MAG: DUF1566 domain-containing protein [bacterium]|nr:DUF1566 domain-containing protein [bacterium]
MHTISRISALTLLLHIGATLMPLPALADYPVVDTNLDRCFDATSEIACPAIGEAFHGQDAQYDGIQPTYRNNGDGTISDLATGLMWQRTPEMVNTLTYAESVAGADTCRVGDYDDWRLPTIKELYSLIDFSGNTGMSAATSTPYIDTDYFDFCYGDESTGVRYIDAQYWSATEYAGTTMNNDATTFGVNFADGRIKGYPTETGPGGSPKESFVRYVRGNATYGANDFDDNGDGTVTDLATGLMWQKGDSGEGLNWEGSLAYAENLTLAEYDDWRLPNAKELQSIVDYSRAPDAADPAMQSAAIDPIFDITDEDSFFWTGTTHMDGPTLEWAVYLAFGRAWGWMEMPPMSGNLVYTNVHGAGAQRSDPKSGDPDEYPDGHGPQGDIVRIYNYVRCVRDASGSTGLNDEQPEAPHEIKLSAVPNPFNPATEFVFTLAEAGAIALSVFDTSGRRVAEVLSETLSAGTHHVSWNATDTRGRPLPSGVYLARLSANGAASTTKLVLSQ